MSEARTPEESALDPGCGEDAEPDADDYDGPDPEEDSKGDGSDEDQGT